MRSDGELAARVRERVAYREDPLGRAVADGTRGLEQRMEREFLRLRAMIFLLSGMIIFLCVGFFLVAIHDEDEQMREIVRASSSETVSGCRSAAEQQRFVVVPPSMLDTILDTKSAEGWMLGCSGSTCTRCRGSTCIQYPATGPGSSTTFTIAPRSLPME